MRAGALALLLVLLAAGARAEPVAYVGATLIDGTGTAPVADAVLLVDGDRVTAAGAVAVPDGARRIDLSGRWLVPGLIDAHVHLSHSASLYTSPDGLDLRKLDEFHPKSVPVQFPFSGSIPRQIDENMAFCGSCPWIKAPRAGGRTFTRTLGNVRGEHARAHGNPGACSRRPCAA